MASLAASCPLLTTLHLVLTSGPALPGEGEGDSLVFHSLRHLPSLRHVRFERCVFGIVAYAALLSLPLISIDLRSLILPYTHTTSQRSEENLQPVDLARHLVPQLTCLQFGRVATSCKSGTEVIEPHLFSSSLLTSLSISRESRRVWDWSLFFDDSTPSLRRLPALRQLTLNLEDRQEGDDAALLHFLDVYGNQLTSLCLTLQKGHPLHRPLQLHPVRAAGVTHSLRVR